MSGSSASACGKVLSLGQLTSRGAQTAFFYTVQDLDNLSRKTGIRLRLE